MGSGRGRTCLTVVGGVYDRRGNMSERFLGLQQVLRNMETGSTIEGTENVIEQEDVPFER